MNARAAPIELLRSRLPELAFSEVRTIDDGWDSLVLEVDGAWIVRVPRRPEVEQWLEREARLLPELEQELPVAVPRFEHVIRDGVVAVAYRKLAGSPASRTLGERAAEELARFLVALHRFPAERARALGALSFDPAEWRRRFATTCESFRARVAPLLPEGERDRAGDVFARVQDLDFAPRLIHGDLGPEHVLCRGDSVVAVIDWSDACVGDPALDLAWCANGTSPTVAEQLVRVYGADAATLERSRFYHQLGPWYEALHGLESNQDRFVASGLEGVRERLRAWPDP